MEYLLLKTLHILSATLLVGTGFGSAFYLYMTHRSGDIHAIARVSALVVRADAWFTTPAIILQPLTGLWMAQIAGYPVLSGWIGWALLLYLFAGACWLPVVWLQIEMRKMAAVAEQGAAPLPERYWRYAKWWERLGYPAFAAMLVVYWLMVGKGLMPF